MAEKKIDETTNENERCSKRKMPRNKAAYQNKTWKHLRDDEKKKLYQNMVY